MADCTASAAGMPRLVCRPRLCPSLGRTASPLQSVPRVRLTGMGKLKHRAGGATGHSNAPLGLPRLHLALRQAARGRRLRVQSQLQHRIQLHRQPHKNTMCWADGAGQASAALQSSHQNCVLAWCKLEFALGAACSRDMHDSDRGLANSASRSVVTWRLCKPTNV